MITNINDYPYNQLSQGPDLTTLGELILEDSFKLFDRPKSLRNLFLFDNVLLITKKKRDGSLAYKVHIEVSISSVAWMCIYRSLSLIKIIMNNDISRTYDKYPQKY